MKADTNAWVAKAESDFETVRLLMRQAARRRPGDVVCFHAQQCVEKYLKARLIEGGRIFPRTHDLETLLNDVIQLEPLWSVYSPAVQFLTQFAVAFRYPGNDATPAEVRKASRYCRSIRRELRLAFGLKP